jgi:hypothetical protein
LRHVLAYLIWLVSIAACVAALLQFHSMASVVSAALGANRYVVRLVGQVILLLGGLAAFIYAVFLEGYYRESVKPRVCLSQAGGTAPAAAPVAGRSRISRWLGVTGMEVLLRRFAITIAVPLGVLVLSLVLLEVALRSLTP